MAILADDDVIMDGDPQRFGGIDYHLRHLNIGPRGGRIAGRVIVDQYHPLLF